MKGAAWACAALAALMGGVAGPLYAAEVDVTDDDRVVENFTREAATVGDGRIRVELRGLYLEENHPDLDLAGFPIEKLEERLGTEIDDIRGGIFDLLGSYGLGANAEVGFLLPFFIQGAEQVGSSSENEEDIGDLVLYGKFKRAVAKNCALAGGFETRLPTGIEKKGFGSGEVGFNPFLSSRYQRGRFGVGGHVGYRIFTGKIEDELNYGVQLLARANELIVFRGEVSGRFFKSSGDELNDVRLLPGFDVNVGDNVVLRPTALLGLSDESVNWGAGLGIVLTL